MVDITREDIFRLVNSQFIIVWHRGNYIIRDTRHRITVAIGFYTRVDALVFLEKDAKVIYPNEKGLFRGYPSTRSFNNKRMVVQFKAFVHKYISVAITLLGKSV